MICRTPLKRSAQSATGVVKGDLGAGKSAILINLMADLLAGGFNTHYATGSRAFTETLRKVIGSRGSSQFRYFNSYIDAGSNQIDVLVADESHRIRTTPGKFIDMVKSAKPILHRKFSQECEYFAGEIRYASVHERAMVPLS